MLQLRPNCEYCDKDLPPNAIDARICTYECTFCADCVDRLLFNVCPNCGVTDFGFRVVLFFTRIYHRLLRPTLAAALSAIPAVTTPLKRAFDALDAQINTMINQAQLAAQNLTRLRQVPFVKQG